MNATMKYRHAGRCSDPFIKHICEGEFTQTVLNAVVNVLALSEHEQDRQTALR